MFVGLVQFVCRRNREVPRFVQTRADERRLCQLRLLAPVTRDKPGRIRIQNRARNDPRNRAGKGKRRTAGNLRAGYFQEKRKEEQKTPSTFHQTSRDDQTSTATGDLPPGQTGCPRDAIAHAKVHHAQFSTDDTGQTGFGDSLNPAQEKEKRKIQTEQAVDYKVSEKFKKNLT